MLFSGLKTILLSIISVSIVITSWSFVEAQSRYQRVSSNPWASPSISSEEGDEASSDEDFDLESCQRYCLGSPAGSNRSAGVSLASCLQDCNERYWRSYDRRMKRLGN